MESHELGAVGTSALGMALMRAQESDRPDRLFADPYADAFLAAAPEVFAEEPEPVAAEEVALGAVFSFQAVMRTRFFDDYLLAAAAAGCRQMVLVAAGLDARAFRLEWPSGVRIFELDFPDVLTFKERVLARHAAVPRCVRTVVPVDLREDWPVQLTEAGFDVTQRTAWLAEGLLIYLSADEAAHLLATIGTLSASESQLSFDHERIADTALLTQARAIPAMDEYTSLWKGGLGQDGSDWLARHGWVVETHDRATLAASFGRPAPDDARGGFVTAVRRASRAQPQR
jgi:methyltransferase (TIGR00027 family)